MNFKDNKPIYLQIAERLCDEILQGKYEGDERIPSVREYAAIVEVNANTVARSFEHLQSNGIIYNKRGIGYFVAADAASVIISLRKELFLNEVLPDLFKSMATLGITFEEIKDLFNSYMNKKK